MSGQAGAGGGGPWPGGPHSPAPRLSLREVLPDSTPATSTAVAPAPVPSNPGLRDSAFSSELAIPDSLGRGPSLLPSPAVSLMLAAPPRSPFLEHLSLRVDFCSDPLISLLFLSSFLFRCLSLLLPARFLRPHSFLRRSSFVSPI